jgi:hypothetical protein
VPAVLYPPFADRHPRFAENPFPRRPASVIVCSSNRHGVTMNSEASYHLRRQILWGLLLIGIGIAFLLDQFDLYDVRSLWHYAPLLLVVVGVNQTIGYPSAKEFTSGLWTVFIGLWLFAVFEGLFGLTFWNSWPLLIIVSGVTMAIRPIAERRFNAHQENRHGQ